MTGKTALQHIVEDSNAREIIEDLEELEDDDEMPFPKQWNFELKIQEEDIPYIIEELEELTDG